MASLNKVILIGNLGADPETRYTPSGDAVTNIRLATAETWKDKNTGERKEQTEWHRVVFYGRLAEIAGEYLRKGRPVYIEGRIQTRKWQGQDGQDRYTTEIIASEMKMLGGKGDSGSEQSFNDDVPNESYPEPSRGSASKSASPPKKAPPVHEPMDDDIPF